MNRLFCRIALGVSLFGMSAFAASWTGYISDSKCGKTHVDASQKSIDCVKKCVDGGAEPVFVVGDKIYHINGADKVKDHLGHKVIISGAKNGDTISIKSLKMAKTT